MLFRSVDKRIEDARAAAAATERQMQTALDKHTATLSAQLAASLKQALSAAHTELTAESQAAEEVFQNRIKAFSEERAAAAERQIERAGNSAALTLDRTMQKESREHERKLLELGSQVEDRFREEQQRFHQQAAEALAALQQQLNQVSQQMFEQVRQARESLLQEIPARLAEAETEFRKNLAAIQEQYLASLTRRPDRTFEPAERE